MTAPAVPYPFKSAAEMLEMCAATGRSVADLKRANELSRMSAAQLDAGLDRIWQVMRDCMDRGLATNGILPGGLNVKRRAAAIHAVAAGRARPQPDPAAHDQRLDVGLCDGGERGKRGRRPGGDRAHQRGGGRGAGGAALLPGSRAGGDGVEGRGFPADGGGDRRAGQAQRLDFRAPNAAVRQRSDQRAAMAAAALCAVLGGTPEQVENAAEIALEHHLGMTCDPVRGLVQVPCIERNGLGAIKAVRAASLSLRGDGTHLVPLDACIETMRQTGVDMSEKYKETSLGGLAVNIPNC